MEMQAGKRRLWRRLNSAILAMQALSADAELDSEPELAAWAENTMSLLQEYAHGMRRAHNGTEAAPTS